MVVGHEQLGILVVQRVVAHDLTAQVGALGVHLLACPYLGIEVELGQNHLHEALVAAAVDVLARIGQS